ncbi:hypothetical protein [Nocardioides lijunqiniae]|uniref:hypothetical protein n=1 Tax=Nocardioides lijunqiniae TaxID=2760832 RepID=UPI0018788D95|nr:hypothetical protein [Nocardioides lijunqiniae]
MSSLTAGRYAAVAATLALAVSLGGTSYAAVKIGTAQLKSGAVTTPKLAKGAVTSAKIKNDAVTGADVKESTLGAVGKAKRASQADAVDGVSIAKVSYRKPAGPGSTVLAAAGGLTVRASCAGGELTLTATTSKNAAYISTYASRDSNPADPLQADEEGSGFVIGEVFDLQAGEDGDTNHVEFAYGAADGSVVTGVIDTDEGTPDCLAIGFVTSG